MVLLERFDKQNETLNVSSWKLTSSKEVKSKKGEVETSLQFMVEAEIKSLEALKYTLRPLHCDLKRAQYVHWSQGDGDKVKQDPMETEEKTGKEEVIPVSQTT